MTKDPYFDLDDLSSSRLGVVKCIRDGEEIFKVKKETLDFGSQFHEAVLEPEKYAKNLLIEPTYYPNRFKVANMAKAARSNQILLDALKSPTVKIEQSHRFNEPSYGLGCKIKVDVLDKCIIDLKSTSEKTLQGFIETIKKYGYHRQGAFYLDGTGLERFILIGVSKIFPHNTFTVILSDEDIQEGREEYEDLINYYIQMEVKPDFKTLMQ